ncbi:beta strand repeat-containing protein [Burkholderia anthina]|uniref:beta strand repeat-containing protein n=1 Tax=Burkholderia anthina TaxID=179879 RepID=UPI00158A398A|nr:matrixin family metalloprotease [Burkholderia anthina]
MGLIDYIGLAAGTVDGNATVAEAWSNLQKNPSSAILQATYNAAYANAIAAEYALVPGVGAVFGARAASLDAALIAQKIKMGVDIDPGDYVSLASNLALVASQGIALVGSGGVEVPIGALTFTADEIGSAVGGLLTAAGVSLDSKTIQSYVAEGIQAIGLSQNSDGSYAVTPTDTSTLELNGITPTLNYSDTSSSGNGQVVVPTFDSNGNVTGYTSQVPSESNSYSNGGTGYTFQNGTTMLGGGSALANLPNSPSGAVPIAQWNIPGSNIYTVIQYSDGTFGRLTTASDGSTTVTMTNVSAPPPDQSNQVSTTDDNGALSSQISGTGAQDDISNAAVTFATGASGTVNGNSNLITGNGGDTFQLTGVGYNVNLSATGAASTVTFTANSGGTVNGSGATVDAAGSDSVTVNGSNNGISESAGDYLVANGGNNIINAVAGAQTYITGTNSNLDTVNATGDQLGGTTANGQPTGILFNTNAAADIIGSNNGIREAAGDYVIANGGDNTIDAVAGAQAYITGTNGNFDTIDGSGDAVGGKTANGQPTGILLSTNAQANVNGSGDGVNEAAGDSVGVYGGGNSIDVIAGTYTAIGNTNGNFDTINGSSVAWGVTTANGQSTGIGLNANSQANVNGSGDGVYEATGDSLGIYGGGNSINTTAGALTVVGDTNGNFDTINASGDVIGGTTANGQSTGIGINANSQANINGSNDGVTEATGDSLGVYGGGNVINAASDANLSIGDTNGSFDTINDSGDASGSTTANGQGSGIWVDANSQANVNGSGDGVYEAAGDSLGVYGGGNTISTVAGALTVVGDTNGAFDTIDGSNDALGGATANGQSTGIGLNANTQVNVNGSNDGINEATGDTAGVYGGGDVINLAANTCTVVGDTNGAFDTIDGSGDTLGGTAGNGQGTGIGMNVNSQVNVRGSDDGVNEAAGDSLGVYGGGNTINTTAGALTYIADTNGNADTIDASGDVFGGTTANGQDTGIYVDGSSQVDVYGSNDGINGSSDSIAINGQDDSVDGNSDTINFSGSNSGDIVDGTGDTGADWSGVDYIDQASAPPDNGDPSGGYGGYYGGYGFSGDRSAVQSKLASDVTAIAQYDQNQGDAAAANAAKNGFAQAGEMARDTATSAGSGPNVLEGARWDATTVTWSFDSANGPQDGQYEKEIEQAFATWAAASGLKFQEVSSNASADISIDWADLNTASTGEVGYTTFKASQGVIASGAKIELESPTQDALAHGSVSDQIYAGTDATFYQTALHEIGHALGLADNADSSSIMNYDLTSSNRSLDQTDVNAIQALYGSSAQTAALIQAMAGHAPSGSATSTSIAPAEQASQHVQLLAGAH